MKFRFHISKMRSNLFDNYIYCIHTLSRAVNETRISLAASLIEAVLCASGC